MEHLVVVKSVKVTTHYAEPSDARRLIVGNGQNVTRYEIGTIKNTYSAIAVALVLV